MIELFDDFRDLLIELRRWSEIRRAGRLRSCVPRSSSRDQGSQADPDNARRVYAALAAFGAPLASLDVGVEDFSSGIGDFIPQSHSSRI